MTARQIFESLLTELSKVNAPSMLLSEFNYYINKAVNQYINKKYNIYDVNQQSTDDLRVLKSTAILDVNTVNYNLNSDIKSRLFDATYEVILPSDYLHILNCICIYKMNKTHKCYNKNTFVEFAAKRLTADSWSMILNDYYNRPLPERPYYYIHNINNNNTSIPTNPVRDIIDDEENVIGWTGTDMVTDSYNVVTNGKDNVNPLGGPNELITDSKGKKPGEEGYEETWKNNTAAVSNFPRTITLNDNTTKISTVERQTAQRYGNASQVRCEIRYGKDNSVFELKQVLIDYLKAPQTINLTQDQVDLTEDTSQIMEYPDYVCQEIINELVLLVMEKTADPRTQSHAAVTQSIANPVQQQQQATQQQQRS